MNAMFEWPDEFQVMSNAGIAEKLLRRGHDTEPRSHEERVELLMAAHVYATLSVGDAIDRHRTAPLTS